MADARARTVRHRLRSPELSPISMAPALLARSGSRGDSYDDVLAESVIGLYKTELRAIQTNSRGLDGLEAKLALKSGRDYPDLSRVATVSGLPQQA